VKPAAALTIALAAAASFIVVETKLMTTDARVGKRATTADGNEVARPPPGPGDGTHASAETPAAYTSPYSIVLATPREDLCADFAESPRNDPHQQSDVAFEAWYGADVRAKFGAWGPRPRTYSAPPEIAARDVTWRRERVIAAAEKLIGHGYQHHHLPDWNPPADWPWKSTCAAKNGPGLDCSNLTTFVYDYALGIRFTSDIDEQALLTHVTSFGGEGEIEVERIERGGSFAAFVASLAPADLIFVKNTSGSVSHVVIWLGKAGRSKDGTPLVLDSHGEDTRDANGTLIPCGVEIRPFREQGWYWRSASHALRILRAPTAQAPEQRTPRPK
jgi:cell wall-associated NlpC family hydrolase